MGIIERKVRHQEKLRNSIINTALMIGKAEGWQNVSIRKVADVISYSPPAIYLYFKNKDEILMEITRIGFIRLDKHLKHALKKINEPCEIFKKAIFAYWKFAVDQSEYYKLMFGLTMMPCSIPVSVKEKDLPKTTMLNALKNSLVTGIKSDDEILIEFYRCWSTLHGLIALNLCCSPKTRHKFKV